MNLFFQKIGEGPVLIILHGLYGSSDNWISIGRKLAKNYTVYLVDQRNHGRSPHHAEHTYQAMASDLQEMFLAEHIEKAYLIGHSMGGKTAMLFAVLHPLDILGLVVVDITPGSYSNVTEYSDPAISHLNIMNTMLGMDFSKHSSRFTIEEELAQTIKNSSVRLFIMKNVNRLINNSFGWKLNIEALCKALPVILGPLPLQKILNGNPMKDFPVLFIAGENSNYILPNDIPIIKKYFPEALFETIPNAGHWVHAEQPDIFFNVLFDFLKKTDANATSQ